MFKPHEIVKKWLNLALTRIFKIQFACLPSGILIRIEHVLFAVAISFATWRYCRTVDSRICFLFTYTRINTCLWSWLVSYSFLSSSNTITDYKVTLIICKNQNYYLFLSYTYVKMVSGRRRDYNLTNKTDLFGICSKLIAILILPTFHSLNFPLSTAINQTLFQYYDATALNLLF